MIRRRNLLNGIASLLTSFGAAATGGSARLAHARDARPSGRLQRIGVLAYGPEPTTPAGVRDLTEHLRRLGYIEGSTVQIDRRVIVTSRESPSAAVAELVAGSPDVIVVLGGVRAALRGVSTQIPIVALSDDLVATGFAKSLARPGGNVTGVNNSSPELALKRLQLLVEAAPRLERVTILGCPFQQASLPELELAARRLGVRLVPVFVRSAEDARQTLHGLPTSGTDGLLVLDCLQIDPEIATTVPASYFLATHARRGALLSYSHHWPDAVRMLADYVDRILKGAKPADLPIQQPTRFDLLINLQTARALGITIPPSLLLRANEVIR